VLLPELLLELLPALLLMLVLLPALLELMAQAAQQNYSLAMLLLVVMEKIH
jgi:hypothetical protein